MDEEITLINKILANQQYIAESKINEGSYGEIFEVVNKNNKNVYALKALELNKLIKWNKTYEAFNQIYILNKLKHPGVVKLFSHFQKQNYIGIVLEFCPYDDLFNLFKLINKRMELLKKKRKIMIYYLAQILQTIDYLHDKKIVHRDLKPQNIVIGSDLKIRIIDFGTAKPIKPQLFFSVDELQKINKAKGVQIQNGAQNLVGSINYLSPQALKLHYSQKSDIWAFGVLAYKFYYGHFPFEGATSLQIFKKISDSQLPIDPKIDPQMQELLVICLKKDLNQRGSAKIVKMCTIFKSIDFKSIFNLQSPIFKEQLRRQTQKEVIPGMFLLEVILQKKMFFGNYKPRILTMSKEGQRLTMAYRYLNTKKVKRQFEINLNDYAQIGQQNTFSVVTGDKIYQFRCTKGQSCQEIVEKINQIIKKSFNLQ